MYIAPVAVVILKIIFLLLLADFFTGVFHFMVDRYGRVDGPYMTHSVNLLLAHHDHPRRILYQTYWELTGGVYKASFIIFPVSLIFGFHWEILVFLLFSANGNIIHKWAPQTKANTQSFIKLLQKTRLIQSRSHHSRHHSGAFNHNFCVMTNVVNPILQWIHFWSLLTFILGVFNIKPVQR